MSDFREHAACVLLENRPRHLANRVPFASLGRSRVS
jgi:hypothetical protein